MIRSFAAALLLGGLAAPSRAGSLDALLASAEGSAPAAARFDGLGTPVRAAYAEPAPALERPSVPAARTAKVRSFSPVAIPDIGGPPAKTTGDYLVKGALSLGIAAAVCGAAWAFFSPAGFVLLGLGIALIVLADHLPTSK